VSTPNYSEAEAEKLKKRWLEQNGGDARSIAVLNSSVTFSPLTGISPVDAEAEKLAHYNRSEIALCFGLDPVWVGEGVGGLAYSNATDRRRDLVDLSLSGWGESLTSTLTACMPLGSSVTVNWASFASPSLEVLVPPLVAAVQAGIITADEARHFLQLPSNGEELP
jgi:phage portal protein BeeE